MKNSLKKNSDFNKVYREKISKASKSLILFILKNSDTESNRLGISVSHKVGNSVVRHTLLRRIREIYRKNESHIIKGLDMIVVLRVGSDKVEFFNLNEEFIYLCKKQGIWI